MRQERYSVDGRIVTRIDNFGKASNDRFKLELEAINTREATTKIG